MIIMQQNTCSFLMIMDLKSFTLIPQTFNRFKYTKNHINKCLCVGYRSNHHHHLTTMIVFAPVQRLLRLGGIWFEEDQSWKYRLYRFVCLAAMLMLLQPQYSFLCANMNDMVAATDVSIQLVSEIMASCKVFGYIYYHRTINEMLTMCQQDADRSKCLY